MEQPVTHCFMNTASEATVVGFMVNTILSFGFILKRSFRARLPAYLPQIFFPIVIFNRPNGIKCTLNFNFLFKQNELIQSSSE